MINSENSGPEAGPIADCPEIQQKPRIDSTLIRHLAGAVALLVLASCSAQTAATGSAQITASSSGESTVASPSLQWFADFDDISGNTTDYGTPIGSLSTERLCASIPVEKVESVTGIAVNLATRVVNSGTVGELQCLVDHGQPDQADYRRGAVVTTSPISYENALTDSQQRTQNQAVTEATIDGHPAFYGYRSSRSTGFGSVAVVTELNDSSTLTVAIDTGSEDDAKELPSSELLEVAGDIAGGLQQ